MHLDIPKNPIAITVRPPRQHKILLIIIIIYLVYFTHQIRSVPYLTKKLKEKENSKKYEGLANFVSALSKISTLLTFKFGSIHFMFYGLLISNLSSTDDLEFTKLQQYFVCTWQKKFFGVHCFVNYLNTNK